MIRILEKSDYEPDAITSLIDEITKLSSLNHPYIAKYYGIIQDQTKIYIVMEYFKGVSLK